MFHSNPESLSFLDTPSDFFAFPVFLPCCVQFIVMFVVKLLKVKEVNDVREYEDEDSRKEPPAENSTDDAGHHNSAQG